MSARTGELARLMDRREAVSARWEVAHAAWQRAMSDGRDSRRELAALDAAQAEQRDISRAIRSALIG